VTWCAATRTFEASVQRFYDLMRTCGSPAHLLSPQLTVAVHRADPRLNRHPQRRAQILDLRT